MKKLTFFCVFFVLILSMNLFGVTESGGGEEVKIVLNKDKTIEGGRIIDNKVFIPVRAVTEAFGADVAWEDSSKTVSIDLQSPEEKVSGVIKKLSPMVVGIIGNINEANQRGISDGIVHGSGFIIKSSGEILTNAHVVGAMERIVVVLNDGTGYEGKIKCIDEESDLAVVQIQKSGLPVATIGTTSDIVIGKSVIALGTPISFSLRNSATLGIISGVNRGIDSSYKLIQTDAAINGGNSGGPLITLNGIVIGVNSLKFAGEKIEGMGFSIPVETIQYVLAQFEKYGKVRRPYLGAEFQEDWVAKVGLPSSSGIEVVEIEEDSPAALYGVKVGDVLLSINGKNINTIVDLNEEMKKYLPDNEVNMKIKRGQAVTSLKVKLSEKTN